MPTHGTQIIVLNNISNQNNLHIILFRIEIRLGIKRISISHQQRTTKLFINKSFNWTVTFF